MDFLSYIHPELLILIPVLMILGKFLKESAFFPDEGIPLAVMIVGITLSALWVVDMSDITWFNALFTSIIQGILCAGTAVCLHQIPKQKLKSKTTNKIN